MRSIRPRSLWQNDKNWASVIKVDRSVAWVAVATKEDYSEYEERIGHLSVIGPLKPLIWKFSWQASFMLWRCSWPWYGCQRLQIISANCRLRPTKRNQLLQQKYPFGQTPTKCARSRSSSSILKVADADYYEVHEKDGDNWRLLTGSSSDNRLSTKVSRSASAEGTTQELGCGSWKNGQRSDAEPWPLIGAWPKVRYQSTKKF